MRIHSYNANSTGWRKKNTVFIEDILDENVVRFTDPCPDGCLDTYKQSEERNVPWWFYYSFNSEIFFFASFLVSLFAIV